MTKSIKKLVTLFKSVEEAKRKDISFDACRVSFAFYCILFVLHLHEYTDQIGTGIQNQNWTGLLRVFSFIPAHFLTLEVGLGWFFGSLILTFFRPDLRILRVSVFLSYICFMGIFYSYGKINNDHDIIFVLSFCFIFFSESEKTNKLVLLGAQALVLTHYFAAGFWKTLAMGQLDWSQPFESIAKVLPAHISHTVAEGRILTVAQEIVINNPWLSFLLWISVILMQLGAFLPFVSLWAWRNWWKLIVLFHWGTLWMLGVDFHPTSLFLVFIFAIAPWLGKSCPK